MEQITGKDLLLGIQHLFAMFGATISRNLLTVGIILSVGLGFSISGELTLTFGTFSLTLSGLFIAVIIGVIMNLVLPEAPERDEATMEEEMEADHD